MVCSFISLLNFFVRIFCPNIVNEDHVVLPLNSHSLLHDMISKQQPSCGAVITEGVDNSLLMRNFRFLVVYKCLFFPFYSIFTCSFDENHIARFHAYHERKLNSRLALRQKTILTMRFFRCKNPWLEQNCETTIF